MKYLSIFASVLLATASAYGQSGESCRTASDPTLQKPELYAGYDCVNLLDSTAVTVQPTGSGSFTVCKIVKVMNTRGAVANRILKYDYDPLTAHAEFHRVTIYKANGDVINLDITQQQDYAAPARAIYWGARQIMMEIGRLGSGRYHRLSDQQKRFHLCPVDWRYRQRRIPFHPAHAWTIL